MSYQWAWTDDRVERLRALWKEGLSAAEICEALGATSRNAIIGKVHRLNLAGRVRKVSGTPKSKRKKPTGTARIVHRIRQRAKAKPLPLPPPHTGPSINILDIGEYQCRRIVFGSGPDTMYCGAPTSEKSRFRFCPHCSTRLFSKEAA